MKIRASSLPRVMSCNASSAIPDIQIDSSSDASRMGDGVHEVLAEVVSNDLDHLPESFNTIAHRHKIDNLKEMRILSHVGINAWKDRLKPFIDMDTLEVESDVGFMVWDSEGGKDGEDIETPAHLDIGGVSKDGETLIINDWKSGYLEHDFSAQVKAYGYGMLRKVIKDYPNIKKVVTVIVWLRSQTIDVMEYTVDEILEYPSEIQRAVISNVYNPSPDNCRYCSNLNCEAKEALYRDSRNMLADLSTGDKGLKVSYSLAKIYPRIQLLESQVKKARTLIKELLKETGQRIKIDEGKFLGITEEERDEISLIDALPFIAPYLLPDDPAPNSINLIEALAPALKISKTKLLDLVGAKAERGEVGRRKADVMASLNEHGCVSKNIIQKICVFSKEDEL